LSKKLAIAPCSWGIEDPQNPDNPSWETVLTEAGKAGSRGIELGPYGYLPTDASILNSQLSQRDLSMVAGTIYDDLTGSANLTYLTDKTRKICSLLSKTTTVGETPYLVVIDAVKDIRNNTAGQSKLAVRLNLDEWASMMENIRVISQIAREEYGIRAVVHPHAGGYLEFEDETEKFLNDIAGDVAGLCLDMGHVYYAGENPSSSLKKFSSRLDYIHFKDINLSVYEKAIHNKMGFFDACKIGVMCSIGKGCVDYNSVFSMLQEIDYSGWITIEQERDPSDSAGTLTDLQGSLNYLKGLIN